MRRKAGIERLNCKRPKDDGQRGDDDARDGDDQDQGRDIDRENRAEQHVHEIEIGAAQRHDEDSHTDRREIECRKTCVLALRAEPRAEDHEEDHGDAGEEPAGAQHRERATRESETDRGTRHYRMREDVADKAHPPQQKQRA